MNIDRLIKIFSYPILRRNKKFLNLHKGQVCYIFGNGASLKNMDLKEFSDYPAIGINHLCLHNDFRALNIKYYVLPESFFFYPFKKNIYTRRKFQKNILGNLFKKSFESHSDITLFTSLTNFLGMKNLNTYYLYHFGHRAPDLNYLSLDSEFSFMSGGLYTAIGLAINLGFSKAYLVGCDYLFSPVMYGHFYDYGPSKVEKNKKIYSDLLIEVNNLIDLCLITDHGTSDSLNAIEYTKFKERKIEYKENNEIIKKEYLEILNLAYLKGLHTNKIFD